MGNLLGFPHRPIPADRPSEETMFPFQLIDGLRFKFGFEPRGKQLVFGLFSQRIIGITAPAV
ncbi:hypothetical protein D1872_270570 [compost metagenome]